MNVKRSGYFCMQTPKSAQFVLYRNIYHFVHCIIRRITNFYLQVLQRPNPEQWYAEQVIGVHTIGKVTVKLMELANIPGSFTNHSLR